ncbi:MAG: hypothetical protein HQL70_04220 [Magnetococcales bacterium]|nr:hypothetical protein [Magnetococcales bacterium]
MKHNCRWFYEIRNNSKDFRFDRHYRFCLYCFPRPSRTFAKDNRLLRAVAKQLWQNTGIGLAICAKVAQRHGGLIRVESILGKGSTFYVVLPVI